MKSSWRVNLIRALLLLFVIGLSVLLYSYRNEISHLGVVGYPSIFIIMLVSNASLFLPVPGWFLVAAVATAFNPFWVAVFSAAGATCGELTGYLAGVSGRGVIEKSKWNDRLMSWMQRFGPLTIVVLGFIPNPLFDAAGIIAGSLKMKWYKFLLWCFIGKMGKFLLFVYFADYITQLFGPSAPLP
jgi:membrane protein YqaA with SNARE-associated domain